MPSRAYLSIPTNGALSDTHRLPTSNNDVYKALARLSRGSLIQLALQWLKDSNISRCAPFLTMNETEDNAGADETPWLAAQSVEELREAYKEQQARKGGKREIIDRILEGDWRHGISLYQLAMADTMYLQEKSTSQKWHALRLVPVQSDEEEDEHAEPETQSKLPHFQKQAFLQSLQREVGPLAKAHFYLTRNEEKTYTLLRIFLFDLPYNTQRALINASLSKHGALEATKSIFVVFPDATPFVYVSIPTTAATPAASESRSLQKLVIDAIPKALSRPQARYTFKTTALSAKTLPALLALRGSGRSNSAAGGWSIFVNDVQGQSALACSEKTSKQNPRAIEHDKENAAPGTKRSCEVTCIDAQQAKRRKAVAEGRFGCSGIEGDGVGIERFEARIDDAFPKISPGLAVSVNQIDQWRAHGNDNQHEPSQSEPAKSGCKPRPSLLDMAIGRDGKSEEDSSWRPDVRLSFQGTHVFAGVRQLVETGIIDGERMPSWMTGEGGVSVGVVRHGRLMAKAVHGL